MPKQFLIGRGKTETFRLATPRSLDRSVPRTNTGGLTDGDEAVRVDIPVSVSVSEAEAEIALLKKENARLNELHRQLDIEDA